MILIFEQTRPDQGIDFCGRDVRRRDAAQTFFSADRDQADDG